MNSRVTIILICLFLLSFSHRNNINDTYKYHAICVPNEKLINIEIDGKIDDWDWVPDNYIIRANELMFQKNASFNQDDLDGYFFVGWNKTTNWIYLVAKIYDDNLEIKEDRYRDWFEFQANTSNSKQNINTNLMTIEFYKKLNGEDIANNVRSPEANWMLNVDEYGKWAINIKKDSIQKRNIITYEIGIELWDEWSSLGEEYSLRHNLEDNQIIGLTVSIFDYDENEERNLLYTISGSGGKYWGYSFYMSDFVLDPLLQPESDVDAIIQFN